MQRAKNSQGTFGLFVCLLLYIQYIIIYVYIIFIKLLNILYIYYIYIYLVISTPTHDPEIKVTCCLDGASQAHLAKALLKKKRKVREALSIRYSFSRLFIELK